MFTKSIHRFIYLSGLSVTAAAMPVSVFATSAGLLIILGNFLLQGDFVQRWHRIKLNRPLMAALLIYLPLLVSAFYSDDVVCSASFLQLWLPLLLSPIVVALSNELNRKEFVAVLLFFVASVFVATIIATFRLKQYWNGELLDVRHISRYISHIRFALMINLSIASLMYLFTLLQRGFGLLKLAVVICMLWFIAFLLVLQSLTGLVTLLILFIVASYFAIRTRGRRFRYVAVAIVTVLVLVAAYNLVSMASRFYQKHTVDFSTLPATTANGNRYSQYTYDNVYENGYLVGINICEAEMRRAWNSRSRYGYDSLDRQGQLLRTTLCRYLTSMNQTKDSVGVYALSNMDISLIENGKTSVIFRGSRTSFYPRFYQLLCEVEEYSRNGQVSGGSVVQRLVYAKSALAVIANNFWLGVGWGDVKASLNLQYAKTNLDRQYWGPAHNQYLTVMMGAGFFGLLVFVFALIYPFIAKKRYRYFLPSFFMVMMLVSMLTADTFDTHIGITLYALFSSLFVFGYSFPQKSN